MKDKIREYALFLSFIWIGLCLLPRPAAGMSIEEAIKRMATNYSRLPDYRCILHKQELIRGTIREQKNIMCKFKKPFSCYMRWTEGPDAGTEILFVKGKYDDKLLVHMGGRLGFLNLALDPNGSLTMRNNRHSVLESHLGHIITLIQSNYEKGVKNKDLNVSSEGLKLLEGRETLAFKAVFPKDKGY